MSKLTLGPQIYKERRNLLGILNYFPITTPQAPLFQHFYFHASNLQKFAIVLSITTTTISAPASAGLPYYMKQFVDILTLSHVFRDNFTQWTYSIALICVWVYFLLFLVLLGLLAFRAVTKRQLIVIPRHFMDHLFQSHLAIWFWIANMILLAPFNSSNQDKKAKLGFEGNDFIIFTVNFLMVGINYVIGGVLALFCTQPFRGQGPYATYTASTQVVIFLIKAVLSPMIAFFTTDNKGLAVTLAVVGFIFANIKLTSIVKYMPFFDPKGAEHALIWNCMGIWLCIVNIIVTSFFFETTDERANGIIYTIFIMLPFAGKLGKILFRKIMQSFIIIRLNQMDSEVQVFKKLLGFTYMFANMKTSLNTDTAMNEFEVYFLGDIAEHSTNCKDLSCICQIILDSENSELYFKELRSLKEGLERYRNMRINEILSKGIERVKRNNRLKLTYSNIILQSQNVRSGTALVYLYNISRGHTQLTMNVKRHILLRIIQESLNISFRQREGDVLNLKSFVDFHLAELSFRKIMISNTQKYLDFWNYFKGAGCKLITLCEKSEAMEKEAEELESQWNTCVEKYHNFYSAVGDDYCTYMRIVRNSPYYANKIHKRYMWKTKHINQEAMQAAGINETNLLLADTLTFYVSMTKEKLGRIMYVSSNVDNVLGYSSDELLGRSINILISPQLAKDHDQILAKNLYGAKSLSGKEYFTVSPYIRDKPGFYSPAATYISIFPYVQNELTYLGVVRSLESEYEFLILTENGFVDGCSKKIGKLLNINTTKDIFISEVCSDFAKKFPKKKTKFVDIVIEATSSDEMIEKIASPKLKRKSFFHSQKTHLQREIEENLDADWRPLNLTRQSNSSMAYLSKEFFSYEGKLVPKTWMKKKFHLLLLKPVSQKNTWQSVATEKSKSKKTLPDLDEIDIQEDVPKVPGERLLQFDDSSVKYANSDPNQTDADIGQIFHNINSLKKVPVSPKFDILSEGILSPKAQQTIASEVGLLDTRVKSEAPVPKFIKRRFAEDANKDAELPRTRDIKVTSESNSTMQMIEEFGLKDKQPAKFNPSEKASSVTSSGIRSKLEQAVYWIPRNRMIKFTYILVLLFLLLCIVQLVVFAVYGREMLDLIEGNIFILNTSTLRVTELLVLYQGIQMIEAVRLGYLPNTRYVDVGIPSISDALLPVISIVQQDLTKLNGVLRNSLNQTEQSLLTRINDWKFPVFLEDGDMIEMNNFEAMTEISMRIIKIIRTPTVFVQEDPNIAFVLDNTLNDLLLILDDLDNIIIEDNQLKLQRVRNLIVVFLVIVFGLGILLYIGLIMKQRLFLRNRNRFLDILLRFDEQEINPTLKPVIVFESIITKNHAKLRNLKDQNFSVIMRDEPDHAKPQHRRKQRKEVNFEHMNRNFIYILIIGALLIILCMIPYADTLVLIMNETSMTRERMDILTTVNSTLNGILLLIAGFYRYVLTQENGMLKKKPIKEAWEDLYHRLSSSQGYLSTILINQQKEKSCNSSILAKLESLILGDLCAVEEFAALNIFCLIVPDGAFSNGIQGLDSYLYSILSLIKTQYDNSGKTVAEVFDILDQQDVKIADLVLSNFETSAYLALEDALQSCTIEDINQAENDVLTRAIIYIFLMAIVAPLFLRYMIKRIETERVGWRKIFRKIPLGLIASSKMLKHFLAQEGNLALQL